MSKSVLITGVCGYIGSVLAEELLKQDYDVVGVDNCLYCNPVPTSLSCYQNFQFICCDVRFPSNSLISIIKNVDVVIPLAAIVGAPACNLNPTVATEVNRDAIINLVKELGGNQQIIYPNTNSGYGQTDGESECTEEDPLNPISLYAVDKCAAERFVLSESNHARYATVFRLATVFGVSPRMRMDLMVNDFTRCLTYIKMQGYYTKRDGSQVTNYSIFDPNYKRNFVHVLDVARAFIYAVENRLEGVYNLGYPPANLTKLELANKVCNLIDLRRTNVVIGEGVDPDQRNYIVSNQKILSAGFEFQNSLSDGIREVHDLCYGLHESDTLFMSNI